MQCLLQTLLTLHSNINSLWCTPTLIASFTSVFSSFTSVNVGKLQYTAVSPLTTGNINPKHRRLRGPRCITKHTCIVTFNNKLIFDWLDGCRHCNQITLSFYCVLHRNQSTFQDFSLKFKDFSRWRKPCELQALQQHSLCFRYIKPTDTAHARQECEF